MASLLLVAEYRWPEGRGEVGIIAAPEHKCLKIKVYFSEIFPKVFLAAGGRP
jgi:hypothetical protein